MTGEPVVANLESKTGTARELHLATCRTLRKYPADSPALVPLTDAEVDEAWIRAVDEDTTTETAATEWPFSAETGWCPLCIVKELKIASDGPTGTPPRARRSGVRGPAGLPVPAPPTGSGTAAASVAQP